MRGASAAGVGHLFESLENRLFLSASPHHAAPRAHPVHAAKPAVHAAKTPGVKTTSQPAAVILKKGDPIFMKFGSVTGESIDKNYTGDIELTGLQWGVSRTIGSPTGGSANRESSPPSVSELTITKMMDKTSPVLLQDLLQGVSTNTVDIFLVGNLEAAGKAPQAATYAEYVLSNVLLSSYSVNSTGDRPSETFTLNFTKVQFTDFPNGSTSGVSTTYDLTTVLPG